MRRWRAWCLVCCPPAVETGLPCRSRRSWITFWHWLWSVCRKSVSDQPNDHRMVPQRSCTDEEVLPTSQTRQLEYLASVGQLGTGGHYGSLLVTNAHRFDIEVENLFEVHGLWNEQEVEGPAPTEVGYYYGPNWLRVEYLNPWRRLQLWQSKGEKAACLTCSDQDHHYLTVGGLSATTPMLLSMNTSSSLLMVGCLLGFSNDSHIQKAYHPRPRKPVI